MVLDGTGAPLLLGSSEATRRKQVRGLLFVCCSRKDEEEGSQGGARARWIVEKEEVGWVDQTGEMAGGWCMGNERIPRWGMSAAAASGRIARN